MLLTLDWKHLPTSIWYPVLVPGLVHDFAEAFTMRAFYPEDFHSPQSVKTCIGGLALETKADVFTLCRVDA